MNHNVIALSWRSPSFERPSRSDVVFVAVAMFALLLLLLSPTGCHGNDSGGVARTTTKTSAHSHRRHSRNFRHGTVEPEADKGGEWNSMNSRHVAIYDETTTTTTSMSAGGETRCPVRVRRSVGDGKPRDDRRNVRNIEGATVEISGSSETSVATAPQTAACECPSADEIRCTGGGLHHVPDFDNIDRIFTGLYIVKQDLRELPHKAFGSLKVTKIWLNFNPINDRVSGSAFAGPLGEHLRELHLGACAIRTLPDGLLVGLERLLVLQLWANGIRRIPIGFFHQAKSLRELVLWGNQISDVDSNTFAGIWNLRRLDLDRNRIEKLDKETFRHMAKLQVLYLGDNRIKAIGGETFVYMRSLRVLRINGNNLGAVYEKTFHGLFDLLSLSLDRNNLSFIPDEVFIQLRNLTTLQLANNHLDHVRPTMFVGLGSLVRLDLSDNKITVLPSGSLRHLNKLRQLYLDGNRLETIRRCAVQSRVRLRELSLVGNPVRCDDCCTASWITELSRAGETSIRGACRLSSRTAAGGVGPSGDSLATRYDVPGSGVRLAPLVYDGRQECTCPMNAASDCVH